MLRLCSNDIQSSVPHLLSIMASRRTTATNQERTPLIARRKRQHHHDPYSPLTHDSDKEYRRSILGRVSAASASLYSFLQNNANSFKNTLSSNTPARDRSTPGAMASSEKNNDDEFYEDTYNDLPWRCSFGTREDVSVRREVSQVSCVGVIGECSMKVKLSTNTVTIGWNMDESK